MNLNLFYKIWLDSLGDFLNKVRSALSDAYLTTVCPVTLGIENIEEMGGVNLVSAHKI